MILTRFHNFSLDGIGTQTQYPVSFVSGYTPLYDGSFDTLGGASVLQGRQITYTFDVTNDTDETIRAKINLFQAAMLHGRALLHGITRDDNRVYTWAKIANADLGRGIGTAGYQTINVTFDMPYPYFLHSDDAPPLVLDDDVAFGEAGYTYSYGNNNANTIVSATTNFTIDNTGPVACPRNTLIITPRAAASIGAFTVHNKTNHYSFTVGLTTALLAGETLYIDTATKTIHQDGDDLYWSFTLPERQRVWMELIPGENEIEITALAVSGTIDITWAWSRHYVV